MTGSRPCPFCGATNTNPVSNFGTSLMVASWYCPGCKSHFEAIKWGQDNVPLDVPSFLTDRRPGADHE